MNFIEPLEARIAPALLTVLNANDAGAGSLRQAILDANSDADQDAIVFDIPGSPLVTKIIRLESPLPAITKPLVLDGSSQDGVLLNTAEVGTNAVLRIEIDGSGVSGLDSNGITIASDGVSITGLAIHGFKEANGFDGAGIYVQSGSNISIQACFIGTDATGTKGIGNEGGGIEISQSASNVTVGSSQLGGRNLISNNEDAGILAGGDNVIIKGNLIGVGIDGFSPLPNKGAGIQTENFTGGRIGGPTTEQNVIAQNEEQGIVAFSTTSGLDIQANSFFRNGQLAIDLQGDGVTFNDPLDPDTGANGRQNMPEITGVTNDGLTHVTFSLATGINTNFRVDFYASRNVDSSGYGEGQEYLGSVTGTTGALGFATGELVLLDTIAPGTTITATATNTTTDQTSEFSRGFNINGLTLVNDTTATWVDGDGDKVTLKVSKGSLDESQFFFGPGNVQGGGILQLVQLTDEEFNGTNVTVTVKKSGIGDGRVALGFIDASKNDLGVVKIRGDIGRIACGDEDSTTTSLKALTVNSFGLAGAFTLPDGIAKSLVRGPVGSVSVAGNMSSVTFEVAPLQLFNAEELGRTIVNSFKVGGSVSGNSIYPAISVDGSVKTLTIGGALAGISGITVSTNVGVVTIGSVTDASISLGKGLTPGTSKGALVVKGNVVGSSISLGESMDKVTILGSLIGTRSGTGTISAEATLSSVTIRGDLVATNPTFDEAIFSTASIGSAQSIERVRIGGSILVEERAGFGSIQFSGRITAFKTLGSVFIGGSTVGSEESPVTIGGIGNAVKPTTGSDFAIRSVTIKGNALNTLILGGISNDTPLNADASIGSVLVGKDWIASSIATGVEDTGPLGYGVGDSLQSMGDTPLVARIASITIKGAFLPGSNPLKSYGFAAEEIVRATVGGVKLPLDLGPSNDSGNHWAFPNLGYIEVT